MIEQIKQKPKLRRLVIWLMTPEKRPRPRLWLRLLRPLLHPAGGGTKILQSARLDIFPWKRFSVGRDVLIEDYTVINNGAGDVVLGNGVRIGIGSVVIGPVTFGDRVGLGQHVFVSGFNHGYADGSRDSNTQELVRKPVEIGAESHIGANSVVVAGVRIGTRCQIGAGSVVTKNIPDYSVAVGNPARVVKQYDFEQKAWVRVDHE